MNRIASLQLRPLQLGSAVQQHKSNQRQNRLIGLQESRFDNQIEQQNLQRQDIQEGKDSKRAARIEQLEGRLYGGAVDLIGQTDDPAQKQAIWQQALEVANKFDIDTTGAPAQLTPETENFIRLKAQAQGYKPAKEETGFTLKEGDIRFDGSGNELARGAEKTADPDKSRELSIKEEANQIRREELGFRQEQANKVSLTPTTQKILDAAQTKSFDSGQQAREMELLARDLTQIDIGGGVTSTTSEKFKQVLGSQEAVTDIRRRFRGFRASQAVSNLPPGVASDKDIELALSGFPAENANSQTIQSFLAGQPKVARLVEGFNIVKSELISET